MKKSNLDMYRDIYEYINDETLQIASINHPELLVALVNDDSLRPFTRADVLMHLSENVRFEYYSLFKDCMNSEHTLIREIAIRYIMNYAAFESFHEEILNKLNNLLEIEPNPILKEIIKESIKDLNNATHIKVVLEDKLNLSLDGKCIHPLTELLNNLALNDIPWYFDKYNDKLSEKYPKCYGFEYVLIQNGKEQYYRLEGTKPIKGDIHE